MTTRKRLRTAALLTGLALTTTLGIPTVGATTGAGGITILYASEFQRTHNCEVIGSDQYGNQAVVCVDLVTSPMWDTVNVFYPYYVWAEAEAYCQTSAGVVEQCANIIVTAEVAQEPSGAAGSSAQVCGHAAGACPVGRLTAGTNQLSYNSSVGCSGDPNSGFDAWGIALGGAATVIELPKSGKNVTLSSNYGSGHYYICM
ncbi:hypothetical protein [Catenulispora rubra]|uniref:hypothetical protein n=1 Tax=Catenulispora rubra TaxID=280293 RepID=UPI0018920A88|nr:hypothetical protein [Catenulispora rubra]